MADHVIVELRKIQASYNGNIESVQHTADMDNGSIINLGDLITGETELRAVGIPATLTLGTEPVLLVASPEVNYETGKSLKDFYNVADKPARAYWLTPGDVFVINYAGITCLANNIPVKGNYVIQANDSLKLTESETIGATSFSGKIIGLTTLGYDGVGAAIIQVVKSGAVS